VLAVTRAPELERTRNRPLASSAPAPAAVHFDDEFIG
jgi:hypothetical protein